MVINHIYIDVYVCVEQYLLIVFVFVTYCINWCDVASSKYKEDSKIGSLF